MPRVERVALERQGDLAAERGEHIRIGGRQLGALRRQRRHRYADRRCLGCERDDEYVGILEASCSSPRKFSRTLRPRRNEVHRSIRERAGRWKRRLSVGRAFVQVDGRPPAGDRADMPRGNVEECVPRARSGELLGECRECRSRPGARFRLAGVGANPGGKPAHRRRDHEHHGERQDVRGVAHMERIERRNEREIEREDAEHGRGECGAGTQACGDDDDGQEEQHGHVDRGEVRAEEDTEPGRCRHHDGGRRILPAQAQVPVAFCPVDQWHASKLQHHDVKVVSGFRLRG